MTKPTPNKEWHQFSIRLPVALRQRLEGQRKQLEEDTRLSVSLNDAVCYLLREAIEARETTTGGTRGK